MSLGPVQRIPLHKIQCGVDIRDVLDPAKTAQLAATIKESGQLCPVIVWLDGETFRLVDGHRRYAAAQLLKLDAIEARVLERPPSDAEGLVKALICNLQRESLTPLVTGRAIRELQEKSGCNASQAAAQLGLSPATVSRLLGLLELPTELVAQVESGQIGISMAYELARIDDPAQQAELARKAAAGQITRDGVSGEAKKSSRRPVESRSNGGATRLTAALAGSRSLTVSGVATVDELIAAVEELLAKARKARAQGLELGTFARLLRDTARQEEAA